MDRRFAVMCFAAVFIEGYLGAYASDRQHLIGFILFLSFFMLKALRRSPILMHQTRYIRVRVLAFVGVRSGYPAHFAQGVNIKRGDFTLCDGRCDEAILFTDLLFTPAVKCNIQNCYVACIFGHKNRV